MGKNFLSDEVRDRKKAFKQFTSEIEAQQTENYYLDKQDSAVNAEEYKQMQNLLQPLQLVSEINI